MGTTGALVLGMLGAPLAQAATAPTSTSVPAPGGKPTLSPEQQGIVDARAKAKATGNPAAVDALTTETALTQVNPDGTLTTIDRIQPVRTKRGGAWADLDATLHRNVDGTLSPAVSSTGLAISGGGSGPMATVTTADGKKLAVSAPFTLPAPTLDGASATYADMLPDVDLQVTALQAGGWRDVIIVRTAAAAADPRLKTLHFPVKTEGLNVSADKAGNLTVRDSDGIVRLASPPPFQWDSAPSAPAAPAARPAVRSRSLAVSPPTAQAAADSASTPEAPGEQAHRAPMGITADNSSLTLTPDPQTFGKGTGPWYLDPTVGVTGQTQAYAQVQEFHPSYTYTSGMSDLGLGYCDYSDCTGVGRQRVYYQIGTPSALLTPPSGAPTGAVVHDSTLSLQAKSASNPSGSTVVQAYDSGSIGSGTTWNNQPCGTDSSPGSHCGYVSSSASFTGTGQINLDVTSIIKTAVASHWGNWTLMLAASDESDDAMRHHLSTNPTITTNYDIAPVISSPRTNPTPIQANTSASAPCESADQPYWIGANQNISLTVNNWSPAGLPLLTTFNLWDNDDSTFSWSGNSGWAGSSNPNGVSVTVGSLTDGHQYGWNAQASDTDGSAWGLSSGNTSGCHFRVDKTPPSVSVSSLDFPPSGTQNPSPTKFNTDTGTFTVTGTDPVPSTGTRASGVACYRWSTNPSPVTNWHCGDSANNVDTGIVAATGTSNAFTYTPGTWGTNVLYVQAQDNAGNYSQPAAYTFYAPWKPGSTPVFGDLTGDRKPDIVLPDPAGNLRLIQPTLDPATAPAISGAASAAPASSTTGWNGVQVTHRASLLSGKAVDDLIVHAKGDPQLYLYKNDGHGNLTLRTSFYKSGTSSNNAVTCQDVNGATITCPADFGGTDWSTTTQILALGTPGGESTAGPNGTIALTQTSLLAVISGRLWLFPPGAFSTTLLTPIDREVSAATSWGNYDLIGPGPANGDNQPTLWARDRTAGTIHAYPLTKNTDGTVNYSALADPTTGTIANTGGITPAAFPTVGSSGDITGDGVPDLWAIRADGKLIVWPGNSADGTANTSVNGFGSGVTLADLRAPLGHWRLNDATGSTTAADTTGQHPLTVQGAAFGPDTVNGRTATVAAFNGTTSAMTTAGSTVNTSQSFTMTAWAKATASGGVVISQDGTNASAFQLWPSNIGGGKAEWKFGMAASDTPNATIDVTDTSNASALVQYNAWQQLTASYNADTSELLLYVNGALASTGLHKSTWQAAGPTVVGRFKQNGSPAAFFNGSIAEVSAYQFASAPTTASATSIQSGTNPVKCIDNQNAATTDGNPVQIWDCYPGIAAQSWSLNANGTITNQGHCLDADHGTAANGTHVLLWTCNGGSNQQWLPIASGALYNPATSRCLDDPDATTANGTQLQVWDCYNIPAQHWSVASYAPVPLAPLPGT